MCDGIDIDDIIPGLLEFFSKGRTDFVLYVDALENLAKDHDPRSTVNEFQFSSRGGLSGSESAIWANRFYESAIASSEEDLVRIAGIANNLQPFGEDYSATIENIYEVVLSEDASAAAELGIYDFPFESINEQTQSDLERYQLRLGYLEQFGVDQMGDQHANAMTMQNILHTAWDEFRMQSAISLSEDPVKSATMLSNPLTGSIWSVNAMFDFLEHRTGRPNPIEALEELRPTRNKILGIDDLLSTVKSDLFQGLENWGFTPAKFITSLDEYDALTGNDTSILYDQVGSFLHDQVIGLFGQDVEQGTDSEGILDLPFEVNLDAILEQLGGLSDGILGEGGFKLPIDIDTSLFDEEGGPLAGLFGGLFGTGEEEGEGGLQIPISFDQASVEEGVTILSEMFSGLFSTGEGEGEEGGSGLQIPIDFDLEAAMEAFAPIQEMIYQLTGAGEDEEGLLNVIQFAVDPEGMALAALDNLLLNLLNIVGGEGEDQTPWILNLVAGEGLEAVQGKVEGILSNLQSIASKPWTATISIIQSVLGGGDGDNRQYGGPVGMTGAYLVGETGPELVTLPQGAYVTPSVRTGVLLGGASGESAGGSVNHNNLYISVDGVSDARSFVRELRYELRAQGLDFAEVS